MSEVSRRPKDRIDPGDRVLTGTENAGTIRKTQHAAIAIDREEILERAAVARRARRRALKGKGAVAAAVAAGAGQEDVEDQADVEKRLEESEKALMAMEA